MNKNKQKVEEVKENKGGSVYTLINKVTGFKQEGNLKGDIITLKDGSEIPVSFDPGDVISSKIYNITKGVVEDEVEVEEDEDDTEDEEE